MENRINKIMTLKDGKKYIVLNQAIYKDTNYFFVVRITEDGEDVTDEFRIIEEVLKDEKRYIRDVRDEKMIQLLSKYLKPAESSNVAS